MVTIEGCVADLTTVFRANDIQRPNELLQATIIVQPQYALNVFNGDVRTFTGPRSVSILPNGDSFQLQIQRIEATQLVLTTTPSLRIFSGVPVALKGFVLEARNPDGVLQRDFILPLSTTNTICTGCSLNGTGGDATYEEGTISLDSFFITVSWTIFSEPGHFSFGFQTELNRNLVVNILTAVPVESFSVAVVAQSTVRVVAQQPSTLNFELQLLDENDISILNLLAGSILTFTVDCSTCTVVPSTIDYRVPDQAGDVLTVALELTATRTDAGMDGSLRISVEVGLNEFLVQDNIPVEALETRLESIAQTAVTVLSGQETVLRAGSLVRALDQNNVAVAGFFAAVDPALLTARVNCPLCEPPDSTATIDYDPSRTDEVLVATLTFTATLAPQQALGVLTIFVEAAGLEIAVLENVSIASDAPSDLLNVDGLESLTAQDLVLTLRWLSQSRPDTGENLVANLPISTDTVTAAALVNLQNLLDDLQSTSDINEDGVSDAFDLRILLRYLSGLRGDALGADVNLSRLRQQLGL